MNEFEEKLTAHHNKAMDDEAGFERVAKASEKAAQRNTQKNNAGKISCYRLMMISPLYPCGKPWSTRSHNETVQNLILFSVIISPTMIESRPQISDDDP